MSDRSVAIAIIGAGSAGLSALRAARRQTDDVVLIEGGPLGTTCARVGCMPSKLLIAAASRAQAIRTAGTFGIACEGMTIDAQAVMARVRALRDDFVGNIIDDVQSLPDEMVLRGEAEFDGDDTLIVKGKSGTVRVRAERVVIATGSRPVVPEPLKSGAAVFTTDDLFEWKMLPQSAAVFGAGLVGLELGQALTHLGVKTRIFGKSGAVGPLTDPKVLEAARAHFCETLDFVPDVENERIANGGRTIEYEAQRESFCASFDAIVAAVGRKPNVDTLNLDSTSLKLDDDGVPHFDRHTGQCGDSAIFIAGDANNESPILHEAVDSGTIAGSNAANYPDVTRGYRRPMLTVMFCEPQIAMVGQTHNELKESKATFETGSVDWSDQGRARVMDEAHGLSRIYAQEGGGKILGAEMFGPRAEHMAQYLALAVAHGLTVGDLIEAPIYHPTFEEGMKSALRTAACELGLGDRPLPYGLDCGPGG